MKKLLIGLLLGAVVITCVGCGEEAKKVTTTKEESKVEDKVDELESQLIKNQGDISSEVKDEVTVEQQTEEVKQEPVVAEQQQNVVEQQVEEDVTVYNYQPETSYDTSKSTNNSDDNCISSVDRNSEEDGGNYSYVPESHADDPNYIYCHFCSCYELRTDRCETGKQYAYCLMHWEGEPWDDMCPYNEGYQREQGNIN